MNPLRACATAACLLLCGIHAAAGEPGFPRILIHNFNVRPPMPAAQVRALAQRNLIILAPVFRRDYRDIAEIRRLNPNVVILQYALTCQVAGDERASLSDDEEVALFRNHPESWLATAPIAAMAKPVDSADRRIVLSKAVPEALARRFPPLLLCGRELMRVERIDGNEADVVRGVLGTARESHAAGARVAVVTQPPSWTSWYRTAAPASEVVNINISDRAPRIAGRQPWEIKADYLAAKWAHTGWRKAFDGFFLDEGQGQVNPARMDLDRDGAADTADEVYGSMDRGARLLAKRLRERCGERLVLVFNNRNDIVRDASGRHREHFVDMRLAERASDWSAQFSNWSYSVAALAAWSELGHAPSFVLNSSQPGRWDDYRQVRFGLATALLYGGYYQYRAQSGDSGNWRHWFDEYSVDAEGRATDGAAGRNWLGMPLAPARQIVRELGTPNLLDRAAWDGAGAVDLDPQGAAVRAEVKALRAHRPDAATMHARGSGKLAAGAEYTLALDARSASPRLIDVTVRDAGRRVRALASLYIGREWKRHVLTLFVSAGAALETGDVSFELGRDEGIVEFDNITLQDGVAEAGWLREFEHGMVAVNPTRRAQVLDIPAGFRKILGTQDARHNDGAPAGTRLEVGPLDGYLLRRVQPPM
jgi:hypothetical protein